MRQTGFKSSIDPVIYLESEKKVVKTISMAQYQDYNKREATL